MGVMDAAKNGLKNAVGIASKAIITVVDWNNQPITKTPTELENEEIEELDAVPSGTTTVTGPGALGSVGGNVAGNLVNSVVSQVTGAVKNLEEAFKNDGKRFEVQFNPATLTLSANKNSALTSVDFSNKNAQGIALTQAYVTMNVDLIFNKVDPVDAFLDQKILLTQAQQGNVKAAVNTLSKLTGSVGFSVQAEIEGLIATTRLFKDVYIKFEWGKMCYVGKLDGLDCEYRMFNPKGEPIYGVVHMSMILSDQSVGSGGNGYWANVYNESFGSKNSTSLNTMSNRVGSYLNFSL